jgi:DmsE family decaheme c-type cytochrome
MFHSATNKKPGWSFLNRCSHLESRRQLTTFGAASVFFLAVVSLASTTQGVEVNTGDDTVSALRDYVQLIESAGNLATVDPSSSKSIVEGPSDATYVALRAFAERIGVDQPESESTEHLPKLAEADNLLDFLRGLNSSGKPSESTKEPATPGGPAAGGTQPSAPVEAEVVGAKVCMSCHAAQANLFNHTLMGRIARTQKGKLDCEGCHGPGSAHVFAGGGRGVGGIISFRPEDKTRTAEENNAICLACHERGNRTNWHGSVHDNRGLMCSNCHTVMKQVSRKFQLKTAFEPDTCFQCHKDRRAQLFRASHMPLREGKMVCSGCHNPHGSFTEALLKKDSVNDVCYTCHAEKRGPFLFEHIPVRENCLNCHDPHGSVNEFSLKLSRPRLCFECHGAGHGGTTSGPGSVLTMGRQCQNCHTAVHGSNSPAGGAHQR